MQALFENTFSLVAAIIKKSSPKFVKKRCQCNIGKRLPLNSLLKNIKYEKNFTNRATKFWRCLALIYVPNCMFYDKGKK